VQLDSTLSQLNNIVYLQKKVLFTLNSLGRGKLFSDTGVNSSTTEK